MVTRASRAKLAGGYSAWRVSAEEGEQGLVEFGFGFEAGKMAGAVDQDQFGVLKPGEDPVGHRLIRPGVCCPRAHQRRDPETRHPRPLLRPPAPPAHPPCRPPRCTSAPPS